MKYFSLFSGIGGFEHGIKKAYLRETSTGSLLQNNRNSSSDLRGNTRIRVSSSENIGFSEIDKYAIQIYKKHFSNHKECGDVTNIKWSNVPDFELICGGFPCQSFSIAGKRGGFLDTRGTLFFQIARAAQEKQPRLLLLENVKGLLSHDKGKTFGTILNTLDEIGYDLQWQVLNSKNFGVPQNRERVFIIGHLRGTSRPQVFPLSRQSNKNTPKQKSTKTSVARALTGGGNTGGNHSGMTIIQKRGNNVKTEHYVEMKNVGAIKASNQSNMRSGGTCGVIESSKIRRLTPTECERLQGFPDGWTEGISDTQRYKCLGNAVTVNVIEAIMEKLIKNLTSPADCVKIE